MSESDPDPEDETETEAEAEAEQSEESADGDAESPVVETVKESDGETVAPNDSENTDATTGDGGDIDGA